MKTRSTIAILSALTTSALATSTIAEPVNTGAKAPAATDVPIVPLSVSRANADESTGFPILTANDMFTWMSWFSTGDPRANCDESEGKPTLTANDLQCFLNLWVEGIAAQAMMNPNP